MIGLSLGLGGVAGNAPPFASYVVGGMPPVLVLDFERGTYGDNPVWWAEAPTQPADAVWFADFEAGRYAA